MTSKLLEELKLLKKGLASIEFKVDSSSKDIIKRENVNERLDKKLDLVQKFQNTKVKINSGGKMFDVSKMTLENCSYNNVLKNYGNMTKDHDLAIFLDLNPKIFKLFLELIRQTNKDYFNRDSSIPIKMLIKNVGTDVFEEEVKRFFIEIISKFYIFETEVVKSESVVVIAAVIQPPAVNYGYGGGDEY